MPRPRQCVATVVLVMLCVVVSGCAVRLTPPQQLRDPVAVHIIDYGRTSSLVIPDARGGHLVKYAYGDWDWYALRKTEWWRAFPAMLWPTPGALGRAEAVQLHEEGAEHIYTIPVERAAAARLQEELDAEFWAGRDSLVATPEVGLEFVPYGNGYWGFNNSNHATARWLRKMDVRVRGEPMWSNWNIRRPSK